MNKIKKTETQPPYRRTMPITIGPPSLANWLKYHYNNHQVTEIIIEIDPTDTLMTIQLKTEEFPEFDKHD